MADKQALNATFFAFRKRDKAVLLPATLTYAVLAIVIFAGFALLNVQAIVDYMGWISLIGAVDPSGAPPSPDAMMPPASVMSIGPSYLLVTFITYVLLAAYEAACLRWMIRGETPGIFGMTLDADTLRVYFGYWIWFFLLIAVYLVAFIALGGAFVSMFAMAEGGDISQLGGAALLPIAIGFALLLVIVYFAVRFAPAAATSIARKRFAFFDAWTVSKGRFWALFGAFFLLWLMFFVLYIILSFVMTAGIGMAAMSQMGQVNAQAPDQAMQALFSDPSFLATIIGSIVVITIASFVLYIAMFGINARAALAALEENKITVAS